MNIMTENGKKLTSSLVKGYLAKELGIPKKYIKANYLGKIRSDLFAWDILIDNNETTTYWGFFDVEVNRNKISDEILIKRCKSFHDTTQIKVKDLFVSLTDYLPTLIRLIKLDLIT